MHPVSHNPFVLSLILLALWQTGTCGSSHPKATLQKQQVATGRWGGQNVQLEVTQVGAQIRFSCATGKIEQSLTLDAEGRFSVNGTFVAEAMGPTREDNPPKSRPATYSGAVRDKSMTLSVTVTGSKQEGGTFELTQGEPGHIRRCH